MESLALVDPWTLYEQYRPWFPRAVVFVVTLSATYLLGRIVVIPSAIRVVRLRNRNNPTLANAIALYLRVVFVVIGIPLATTAAGFGKLLSGSAIVVAAATLAVGVAGQDVISNLVSGAFLVMDANFNVGDYIEWNSRGGTVVAIGLRTTRVRTPDSELLTVPNNDLSTRAVRHPYDMSRYRVTEPLTVAYRADLDTVREILVDAALETDRVLSNPEPQIHVTKLDDSAIRLEVHYWVGKPKGADIVKLRSTLAGRFKERLLDHGIAIAPATGQELSGHLQVSSVDGQDPVRQ